MSAHRVSRSFILRTTAAAALLVVASLAFAARLENPPVPPAPAAPEAHAVAPHAAVTRVVHGKPGEHGDVKIDMDGHRMTVIATEDGKVTTTVVDLEQVGDLVGDAVKQAMDALKDTQLQVRVGQDNRIDVSTADGTTEVDLDAIMADVAKAVQAGLEEIDTGDWSSHGPRDARDEAELRKELADLQKEMRGLREELHHLQSHESITGGK